MLDWFETQAPIRKKLQVLMLALVGACALNLLDIPAMLLYPDSAFVFVAGNTKSR